MSVLDLPLQRQIEIATNRGKSHAEWVKETQEAFSTIAAYEESIKDAPESKLWKNPEFQKRVNGEAGIFN